MQPAGSSGRAIPAARQVSCPTPRQPVIDFSRLGGPSSAIVLRACPRGARAPWRRASLPARLAGRPAGTGISPDFTITAWAGINKGQPVIYGSPPASPSGGVPRGIVASPGARWRPRAPALHGRIQTLQRRAVVPLVPSAALSACEAAGSGARSGAETAAMGPEVKEQVEGVAPSSLRRSAAGTDFPSTLMAQSTASAAL